MEKPKNNRMSQDEINQMEQELVRMEIELNNFYCEAGKTILEKAEREERKINDLVEHIIETRRKLVDAKDEKYCPECEEHNERGSGYCKRCGYKFKTNVENEGV